MSSPNAGKSLPSRWRSWLILAGLIVAIVGYWGPWVDHAAAALVIPGFDLAEFVKFLPQVRAKTIPVTRELFYLPATAAAICLALFTGSLRRSLSVWFTVLLAILTLWLTGIVAPPADLMVRFPQDISLRTEWGKQAIMAGAGLLAAGAALAWAGRLQRWLRASLIVLVAAAGTAIPLWQFFVARPAIDQVYNKPVTLGWGLWLMPVGFALVILAALWQTISAGEVK